MKNDWIQIKDPNDINYEDLKDVEVKTKVGKILYIKDTMPVVFGSTMNDGSAIKLFTDTGQELYLYQNGQLNYIQAYRKIKS